MKRWLWTIPALMIGTSAALAGASSENRLDEKALEGPGGEGAHSTDPGTDRTGSPGPSGPSDAQKPTYKYNESSPGSATTGSGASETSPEESNTRKPGDKPSGM